MSWLYRNYLPPLGRWTQADKLGIIPNDNGEINPYDPTGQYKDGLNLYEALASNPVVNRDSYGLACGISKYETLPWSNLPWSLVPHVGLYVDGEDFDYGPGGPGGKGTCKYGGKTPEDETISFPLLKRNVGTLKAGPKKKIGCKCECVTCDDIKSCIREKCDDWDKTKYNSVYRNCLIFVNSTRWKCCLW